MSWGTSWIDGGDFNDNIRGWRSYYQDHNVEPYSFSYQMDELQRVGDGKIEFIFSLTKQISLGFGLEFLYKKLKGEMSWDVSLKENYTNAPDDHGVITTTEESFQEPQYRIRAFPLVLTLYFSIPLGERAVFSLGAGGGLYQGTMRYREDYMYSFDYVDERTIDSSFVTDVDLYYVTGEYRERSSSFAFGCHGGGTFELQMGPFLSFVVDFFVRRVNIKNWSGSRIDSYDWEHTWGFFGGNYEYGSEEEETRGSMWRVDFQNDVSGNSYPRIIFSEDMPLSPSFDNVRKAGISLNGISLRFGFLLKI